MPLPLIQHMLQCLHAGWRKQGEQGLVLCDVLVLSG